MVDGVVLEEGFRLSPKELASALIDELTVVAVKQKVS